MGLSAEQRKQIEEILKSHGYTDYKWVEPKKIVVLQRFLPYQLTNQD